jgi:hypothetical protein
MSSMIKFSPLHHEEMVIICRAEQISFLQVYKGNISTEYMVNLGGDVAQFQISQETYTEILKVLRYNA